MAQVRPRARMRAADHPIEEVKVAFCLAGASRSLPTIPVLRGLKKNVMGNKKHYVASAFAALSLDPHVPGIQDYNLTLANKLSNVLYVQRAMLRLQPELKSWVVFNKTEVLNHYGRRSCATGGGLNPDPFTTPLKTQWLTALYAMQRVYSLVRAYEVGRPGFTFDFVVRLRPDQLHTEPFPVALNRSVPSWAEDEVLKTTGFDGVAVVPQGPLAAIYFRTFAAAASCTFVSPHAPDVLSPAQQCWRAELETKLGPCLINANLAFHQVVVDPTARSPGPLASMCNFDALSGQTNWPHDPMPSDGTCVTYKDVLKRPRPYEIVEDGYYSSPTSSHDRDKLIAFLLLVSLLAGLKNRKWLREQFGEARSAAGALAADRLAQHGAEGRLSGLMVRGEEVVQAAWRSPRVRKVRETLEEWGSVVDSGLYSFYGSVPASESAADAEDDDEEGELAGPASDRPRAQTINAPPTRQDGPESPGARV